MQTLLTEWNLLWGLVITLLIYYATKWAYLKSGGKIYLQPIIIGPAILVGLLLLLHIPYRSYATGGNIITFMLTPATVAFAVPLYKFREMIKKEGTRLLVIITIACSMSMFTSIGLGHMTHLGRTLELSLAPRSVTTPLAISASTILGGNPTITAVLVILTGVVGMIIASIFIKRVKINNYVLKGLLLGITAHGTGTAKAYEDHPRTGAIASIAMIFMGIVTTAMVPVLIEAIHIYLR